jgi:hypothetical protein
MTERASVHTSQGNRPYSVPAMPDEMMLSYTLMGLSAARSTLALRSYLLGSVAMGTQSAHSPTRRGCAGVVFRAICLAPIDASGVLGRLPAKSGELEPSVPNRFELRPVPSPSPLAAELGAWRGPYHSHCPSRWCHRTSQVPSSQVPSSAIGHCRPSQIDKLDSMAVQLNLG